MVGGTKLVGMTIWIGTLLASGCSPNSSSGTSRLAGRWHAAGPGLRVLMGQDEFRTETLQAQSDQNMLMIREDGSIDLSCTILGMIEGSDRLRKKGDRVYLDATSDSSADFIEVESSTSSATRSESIIVLHHKNPAQTITTLFSAQLVSSDQLLFAVASYEPGATAGVQTVVLKR